MTFASGSADARPAVTALAYVGVSSDNLEDWTTFACDFAGMQRVDSTRGSLTLRMDDRRQRFLVSDDDSAGFFGFEVSDRAGLDELSRRLDGAGVAYAPLSAAEAGYRCVAEGLWFTDPEGNRIEACHGLETTSDPFLPGRSMSGFRTGPLGLGHAVFLSQNPQAMIAFYRDVLGFLPSDYTKEPFEAYFFHLNPRHHSLAVVAAKTSGIHHVMVEVNNLDDVGQGYDLAQQRPKGVGVTLGRHSNDHMTSFYARTPSGFLMEYGWGGLTLDPATWQAYELTEGPSLWGHDRDWLPEDLRRLALEMRMQAAADGRRFPVHVQPGNYDVSNVTVTESID